ncbi:MAG: hypothetical protein K8L97_06900 [Anaerolineae bacterium]|nr:hypothetical protein [Anaerolineae bacterium]
MATHRRLVIMPGMLLMLLLWLTPLVAQEGFATNTPAAPSGFATNTPVGALNPAFPTNTPQPTPIIPNTPDAPFERYALRLWDESSLTLMLLEQVMLLKADDSERQLTIRLLQNELRRRFPGAPADLALRESLLAAMLAAPRGSVDMRPVVRPYIEYALNQLKPTFDSTQSVEFEKFGISIIPANLDADGFADAVVGVQYPAEATETSELLYSDYMLVRIDESGIYRVLESNGLFPAAPLNGIESVTLERIGDLNGDRLDEIAVSLTLTGEPNRELMIFGYRGGAPTNLVVPNQQIRYASIEDWPFSGTTLTAREYRVESAAWGCLGERDVNWAWSSNFFRPPTTFDNFTYQSRLGCLMYSIEPIFEKPVEEAIDSIQQIIPQATPEDVQAAGRAAMVLAVLQVFNSDPAGALEQVRQLAANAEPDSWLEAQTTTFLNVANEPNFTPLKLCAALETATANGACSVEQVLMRVFAEQPFRRDEPIAAQAAQLGLTIIDQLTITTVGRLDRQAVHFDLGTNSWWAFAPLDRDVYTAERISPPPGYEATQTLPPIIRPPENAVNALLLENNPEETLNVLDNAIQSNPGVPLDAAARFLQAISYDLLGDRTNARQAYFDLWVAEPDTIWGQLAAAHLERR